MTMNITLPVLGKGKKVKDCVISILSNEWPLTGKKIYNTVRKQYGLSVTYQAVHKALKQLTEDDILLNPGREYKLNEEWLKQLRDFGDRLRENYKNNKNGIPLKALVFDRMTDVDTFLMRIGKELLSEYGGKEKPKLYFYWTHLWMPLFLDKKAYMNMRDMASMADFYILCKSKTPIDRWCASFWGKSGLKIDTGVDLNTSNFVVFDDYVIQVFYPDGLLKGLKKMFSSAKSIHDLDVDALFKTLFERETTIPVTVDKNPILAKQLTGKFLKHFKK